MKIKLLVSLLLLAALLALPSCAHPEPYNCDDYSCTLYTLGGTLTKIAVTSPDGSKQTLRAYGDAVKGNSVSSFELIDLNFDGHDDIRYIARVTDVGYRYDCFIYEPIAGIFSENSTLNSLISPTVDAEAKTISSYHYKKTVEPATEDTPAATIIEAGLTVYGWVNQRFSPLSGEMITYYSESDIYKVSTYEPNDEGKLESVRDRWLSPEQYDRAGYPPIESAYKK